MPERLREAALRLTGWTGCVLLAVILTGTPGRVLAGGPPAAQQTLPDPLTLTEALSYADAPNPELDLARAGVDAARSAVLEATAGTGLRSYLYLTPHWGDSSIDSSTGLHGDSNAELLVTKRLYDFGQTPALIHSAEAAVNAQRRLYFDARQQRRLEIVQCFFAVLLADAQAAYFREATAYHYVSFDKARDRHQLGRISDVDLLAYEDRYRQARLQRTRGEAAQRLTRARLAVVLNHPGDLPDRLVRPALPRLQRPAPDYAKLLAVALEANPLILALQDQMRSARERVAAAKRRNRPVLEAELAASARDPELDGRHDSRATLNLCIPLYQKSVVEADVARARAQLLRARARLARARHVLRTTLRGLVEQVGNLRAARKAVWVSTAYRDLDADRSRVMYDLEIKTDLGDAMAKLTEAQWQAAKVDYQLAFTWDEIDALTGKLIAAPPGETAK